MTGGVSTTNANVSPLTSTPSMSPRSMWKASIAKAAIVRGVGGQTRPRARTDRVARAVLEVRAFQRPSHA